MPAKWFEIRSWRLGAHAIQSWFLGTLVFVGLGPPIAFFVALTAGYILPNSLQGHFVRWSFSSGDPIFSQVSSTAIYVLGALTAVVTGMIVMVASAFLRWQLLYVTSFLVGFFVNATIVQLVSLSSHPQLILFDFIAFKLTLDFNFVAALSAMACMWLSHPLWLSDGKLEMKAS